MKCDNCKKEFTDNFTRTCEDCWDNLYANAPEGFF